MKLSKQQIEIIRQHPPKRIHFGSTIDILNGDYYLIESNEFGNLGKIKINDFLNHLENGFYNIEYSMVVYNACKLELWNESLNEIINE